MKNKHVKSELFDSTFNPNVRRPRQFKIKIVSLFSLVFLAALALVLGTILILGNNYVSEFKPSLESKIIFSLALVFWIIVFVVNLCGSKTFFHSDDWTISSYLQNTKYRFVITMTLTLALLLLARLIFISGLTEETLYWYLVFGFIFIGLTSFVLLAVLYTIKTNYLSHNLLALLVFISMVVIQVTSYISYKKHIPQHKLATNLFLGMFTALGLGIVIIIISFLLKAAKVGYVYHAMMYAAGEYVFVFISEILFLFALFVIESQQ